MALSVTLHQNDWDPCGNLRFGVAEDNKFAECHKCAHMVSRGGDSARNFNTTNLVYHLKSNHKSIYREFLELKYKKEKERQESRNVRVQKSGFTGLRQLSVSLESPKQLNKHWDMMQGPRQFIND